MRAFASRGTSTLLTAILLVPSAVAAQDPNEALRRAWTKEWIHAVEHHRPGELEPGALTVALWEWERAEPVLKRVIAQSRSDFTPLLLLRGAAMYLDVSRLVAFEERPVYPTPAQVIISDDGRYDGPGRMDSQMWWAAHLVDVALDIKSVRPKERELAALWYRAAAGHLASTLSLADLHALLTEAIRRFPANAGLLFDAGCLQETFAMPAVQAVVAGRLASPGFQPHNSATRHPVQSAGTHLDEAQRLYRRALAEDPQAIEARVRLAFVLTLRGRPDEALATLQGIETADVEPVLKYYALIVLGRSRTDAQQPAAAIDAFAQAAALFPQARAPYLGISRAEANRGDLTAARHALEPVLTSPHEATLPTDDPWWRYERCGGRDPDLSFRTFAARWLEVLR